VRTMNSVKILHAVRSAIIAIAELLVVCDVQMAAASVEAAPLMKMLLIRRQQVLNKNSTTDDRPSGPPLRHLSTPTSATASVNM